MIPSCAVLKAVSPSLPSPWLWTGITRPRPESGKLILSMWWPGEALRNLSANILPRAVWLWWKAACKSGIGPIRTAISAGVQRWSPTACISATPNGTARAPAEITVVQKTSALPLPRPTTGSAAVGTARPPADVPMIIRK